MEKPKTVQIGVLPDVHAGSRPLTIALYVIVTFFYWMALYLYVPTLPTYTNSKTSDLALVGVVLSMYGLWQAIIRLPLGIVADWLGRRKPFIAIGIALAGLGAWVMGTADGVNGLIVGRAITGLAAGTWVPLVVVFSSLFPAAEAVRAAALLTMVGSIGRVLATGVTGSLNQLGGYSLAFFLAAGTAAVAILLLLPANEMRYPPRRPSVGQIGRLITRRDVLLPALLSAIGQYVNWATSFGFLPILAKQVGATDVQLSMLVSTNLIPNIAGNLLATAIVKRLGARRLAYLSFLLLTTATAIAALAPTLPLLFVSQICIGLAMGTGYPVLMGMSIRYVADAERTTAMGLHQAVYAFGMFGGPWLSGILADAMGIRPMLAVTAVGCVLLGVAGTRWLVDRERA